MDYFELCVTEDSKRADARYVPPARRPGRDTGNQVKTHKFPRTPDLTTANAVPKHSGGCVDGCWSARRLTGADAFEDSVYLSSHAPQSLSTPARRNTRHARDLLAYLTAVV